MSAVYLLLHTTQTSDDLEVIAQQTSRMLPFVPSRHDHWIMDEGCMQLHVWSIFEAASRGGWWHEDQGARTI